MVDRTRELLTELVKLRSTWESRVVEVKTGDLTTTLFVSFGEIAAVKASKPGEPIGRLMLRRGVLSREHYVEVLERLSDVANTGERVAFGEVAVGLGYAKAQDVSACLAEQVRGLAMRVFQGAAPEWTIQPLPDNRDPSRDLVMRVEAVFLEAVRLLDQSRKEAIALGDARPLALRPAWTLQEIDVRFEFSTEEADFVRVALAGDKTVEQLLSASAPDAVEPNAVLTALIASGAAESRKPVQAETHDKPERRKEPPPLPGWATVDAAKAKGAAETAVRARGGSLAPKKMNAPSPVEQMLRAEQIFEKGREAFAKGDVKTALAEFERAIALYPGSIEYQLFAKWTQHRLAGGVLRDPARSELESRAREAIQENPRIAIAHFVLSAVHEAVGRAAEAKAELARARELDRELFETRAKPAAAPAPAAKSSSPVIPIAIAGVLLVVAAVVVWQLRTSAATPAPATTATSAPPTAIATSTPTSTSTSTPTPTATATPTPTPAHPTDATHGIVLLPKSAEGHRLFVDGHTYTGGDPVVLPCGHHDIQVGSHGETRSIDVPCGGQLDLR